MFVFCVVVWSKGIELEVKVVEYENDLVWFLGLKDGRDVYLLRFESVIML